MVGGLVLGVCKSLCTPSGKLLFFNRNSKIKKTSLVQNFLSYTLAYSDSNIVKQDINNLDKKQILLKKLVDFSNKLMPFQIGAKKFLLKNPWRSAQVG